ncbi:hypothetical protein [Sphingopyxis sp. RIFCSPHIGHO2_12_FULL_65_19]|uniref:hypothetical protein n=1 Tax=Sphingopyxis sp. RIFCSPHIGHO2_12_FULL_65_19 TaxID=1802172 RepID=UPI0008BC9771|nr:hypothetical protein [Sphingopyxis sp. RIFCSPHIGHO2_12_FULL_65_19]OHD08268.1 MAG: hypothetical protein A3E77_04925 [Sphingopyxis sp. RIFCSPHIGHO2_12_FULL_65_19]
MRLAFLIPPMMLLAACGSEEKKTGEATEVSINAEGDGGGIRIKADQDGGKIKIGGDGAAIDIDIPDFVDLDIESDFDIDGVKLYPGSKVTKVDVDASDKNGIDKATVKLGFTSPAAPKVAADWMAGEFAKKGVKVTRSGDTLAGKDKDGADFRINFGPDGANAKGEVVITKV